MQMNKIVTSLLLSLSTLAALAASNTGLPDISVYPAPNTTVETITSIQVVTGFVLPRNHEVSISFNGASQTVAVDYAGDMESVTYTLSSPITRNGNYEIIIPANSFGMGYEDEPNPEICYRLIVDNPNGGDEPGPGDIINQVPNGFSFRPEAGQSVAVLDQFSVTGITENFLYFGPYAKITINGEEVDVVTAISGDNENKITFTLAKPIYEPGNYTIRIPEGSIIYSYNQLDAPSFMVTVIVTGGELPTPDLYPADKFSSDPTSGSTVVNLSRLAIMSEKLTTLYLGPEYEGITIARDGEIITPNYTLTPDEDDFNEAHVYWMTFSPRLETKGNYVITFPEQCFKVNKYPVTKYSEEFSVSINVDPLQGVEELEIQDSKAEYFDILGRRLSAPTPGSLVIERRQGKTTKRIIH